MLEAQGVTVRFGGRPVVRDVGFSLAEGQWLMLVGPNGAGKTTLMRAVSRVVAYEGTILLEGKDIRGMKSRALAKKIAMMSQARFADYAFPVEEAVRMGRYAHRGSWLGGKDADEEKLVEEALRAASLTDIHGQSVLTLSGGEAQRVALARAFAQNPAVLMLDEPVNHLDIAYQKQLLDLLGEWLQKPGRAVISVMHDISLAKKYGTHALLLREGRRLAWGETGAVLTQECLRAVYGMDVAAWMRDLLGLWREEGEE